MKKKITGKKVSVYSEADRKRFKQNWMKRENKKVLEIPQKPKNN